MQFSSRFSNRASSRAPLVALVDATAEWHAGTPPNCSASVRLLDRVHFTVHRGDCVVVHHDDPASARVLLAALAGDAALAPGRRLFGERHCAPSVRVRRCSISADALSAILEGWRELYDTVASRGGTDSLDRGEPTFYESGAAVHLLRASRAVPITEHEHRQWRTWSRRVRMTGGAIVAVARPQPVAPSAPEIPPGVTGAGLPRFVQETPTQTTPSPEVTTSGSAPRGVWLRHGQLHNLRQWE